jgi:peptidoglycan/LPS O-acetylase OafA/YrhL
LAILLVLGYHGLGNFTIATRGEGLLRMALSSYGWAGVDLFFVLSGFLITGILLDAKGETGYFSSFYMRRVLRIFPLYYGSLLFFFFLLPMVSNWAAVSFGHRRSELPWYLAYLVNYKLHLTAPLWHFWSLCVEEQFYLVWPLLIYLLPRRVLILACLSLTVFPLALRFILLHAGFGIDAVFSYSITRVDALTWGAIVAILARTRGGLGAVRSVSACVAMVTAISLAVLYMMTHGLVPCPITGTIGLSVLDVFFASGLILVLTARDHTIVDRIFTNDLLRSFGKYSYAIYVFHWPLLVYMRSSCETESGTLPVVGGSQIPSALVFCLVVAILSYCIGFLSYHLFEKHFLKLKRYFEFGHAQ